MFVIFRQKVTDFAMNFSTLKIAERTFEPVTATLSVEYSMLTSKSPSQSWNITDTDLKMFVEFMQHYNAQHYWNHSSHPTRILDTFKLNHTHGQASREDCADYCKGDFYQLLKSYNINVHGYVSLMVNISSDVEHLIYCPVTPFSEEYSRQLLFRECRDSPSAISHQPINHSLIGFLFHKSTLF